MSSGDDVGKQEIAIQKSLHVYYSKNLISWYQGLLRYA